jgi:hypothetical protein
VTAVRSAVLAGGVVLTVTGAAMMLSGLVQLGSALATAGDAATIWNAAANALNNLLHAGGTLAAGALAVGGALGGPLQDAAQSAYDGISAMGSGAVAAGSAAAGAGRAAAEAGAALGDTLTTPANTVMDVARDAARSAFDAGVQSVQDSMTPTYSPGTSPVPQPGETYNFPGLGKATVNSVDHSSTNAGFGSSSTTIHTDQGTITHYGSYTNSSRRH